MRGIDPETGRSVSGSEQAALRIKKAFTTEQGTVERRRKVGGKTRKLFGLANEPNRLKLINRTYALFANPENDLLDIKPLSVAPQITDAGFRTIIAYEYNGERGDVTI